MQDLARERVQALLRGAARLANPNDVLGRRVRADLVRQSALSPENIELALTHCLETQQSAAELAQFLTHATPCTRAHVLLASNVFVAANRAIMLALASSEKVSVRPSRREPVFVRALADAAPNLFEVVTELSPEPHDHLWAYGSDETMRSLRGLLESGVVLHTYGTGIGIVVLDEQELSLSANEGLSTVLRGIALDACLFDQRGCLSPRLVFVTGGEDFLTSVAAGLRRELSALESSVPPGQFSATEIADISWYRGTVRALGTWQTAGTGGVATLHEQWQPLPPLGRNLNVCRVSNLAEALRPLLPLITQVACVGDSLSIELRRLLPGARLCAPGMMQCPPLDGPVDLRGERVQRG